MAAITVTTANARVVDDIIDRLTLEPAVAITAGQVIRPNSSNKWVLAQGDSAGNATNMYIATRSAGPGVGLTGVRIGKFTGIDTAITVGSPVYVSDSVAGGLDGAAPTVAAAGLIGRVVKPGVMTVQCPL